MIKSTSEIRDRILSTINAGLVNKGILNPNVGSGSDYYIMAQAFAETSYQLQEDVLAQSEAQQTSNLSDTALDDEMSKFGMSRRVASKARGYVQTTVAFNNILIPANSQLTCIENGQIYVTINDTYVASTNLLVEIESKNIGLQSNVDVGKAFKFSNAPAGVATTCISYTAIEGGSEVESDESASNRLAEYKALPPTSGNVGDVIQVVKNAHPLIDSCYVYPCINGPASCHVAITQNHKNMTSKSTVISNYNILNKVQSELQNKLPAYCEYFVTSVVNRNQALSIELITNKLFKDEVPFPTRIANGDDFNALDGCAVLTTNGSVITFQSTINPSNYNNIIKIAYVDSLYQYHETDFSIISSILAGSSPNQYYEVTGFCTKPLNVTTTNYIFPAIQNAQAIIDSIVDYIGTLAPGEKTDSKYLIDRATYQPKTQKNVIDYGLLKYLETNFDEILEANVVNANLPITLPIEPSVWEAPRKFYLTTLAFYSDVSSFSY